MTLREQLSEQRHQGDEGQQEIRRVNREVQQREERIATLEKALEESRAACEERHRACLEVTQELRLAREQSQRSAQQWQDAQRELARLQRQQESLIGDLEDMGKNERQKECHVTELTERLAASNAVNASVEEKYGGELERLRNDITKLHRQHQDELERLHVEHSRQLIKARTEVGDHAEELRTALERERDSREEYQAMRDVMTSLEQELLARKQVIEAANDTIVMKEAEIARLEAKLSGISRENKMKIIQNSPVKQTDETLIDRPDFLPSFLARDSDHLPTYPPIRKSPINLHDSTLFSGLDPNSSSVGPSFIHIAASTKRPSTKSASDLISLPGDKIASPEADDSLFARVFSDNGSLDLSAHGNLENSPDARGRQGATSHDSYLDPELRPDQCMADLQQRLRASEQRRQEVTSKLRQLKSSAVIER